MSSVFEGLKQNIDKIFITMQDRFKNQIEKGKTIGKIDALAFTKMAHSDVLALVDEAKTELQKLFKEFPKEGYYTHEDFVHDSNQPSWHGYDMKDTQKIRDWLKKAKKMLWGRQNE